MTIYVLIDPREESKIRYVGKTNGKLNRRLNSHLYYAKNNYNKSYSGCWLKSLIKQKIRPLIFSIEECSELNWEEREKHWIKFYKEKGHPITNIEEGGLSKTFIPVKLRKERKGKKVYMHQNGVFIRSFSKVKNAAKYIKGNRHVVAACANGNRPSAYGYQWSYTKNDFNKGVKYKIFFMEHNNKERVFYSIKEAIDHTGLSRSSIDKCLRKEKDVILGYRFYYLKKGAQ